MSELVDLVLKSKHKNWEYEEEVRLVRALQNCDEEDELYFSEWNHVTMLKEVVLGDRYQLKDDTGIQGILENSGVTFITARPEFKGFKMTPQKHQKLHKIL